jgi:hypothetical protein
MVVKNQIFLIIEINDFVFFSHFHSKNYNELKKIERKKVIIDYFAQNVTPKRINYNFHNIIPFDSRNFFESTSISINSTKL